MVSTGRTLGRSISSIADNGLVTPRDTAAKSHRFKYLRCSLARDWQCYEELMRLDKKQAVKRQSLLAK